MVTEAAGQTERPQPAADFYEQLVACLPHLRAFARVLCRQHDLVDDLVQDAVVRALAAAGQFQPGTNFRAWMFTILRNQNITTFRRRRMYPISLEDTTYEAVQSPSQEHALMMQDLEDAVRKLSRERREALVLVVVHGLSYEEAASVCGCAVGTIKSRVARARAELQVSLTGEERNVAQSLHEPSSLGTPRDESGSPSPRRPDVPGSSGARRGFGGRRTAPSPVDFLPLS